VKAGVQAWCVQQSAQRATLLRKPTTQMCAWQACACGECSALCRSRCAVRDIVPPTRSSTIHARLPSATDAPRLLFARADGDVRYDLPALFLRIYVAHASSTRYDAQRRKHAFVAMSTRRPRRRPPASAAIAFFRPSPPHAKPPRGATKR